MYDIVIIGAGISGTFLARDLSRYQLKLALLDKEEDIACGATMANSAIVHSGHDPKPGTLKERLNVRGNAMYEDICKELGVAFRRCSALVAATSPEEQSTLDILEQQALDRQVPVMRLSRQQIVEKEPHISDRVIEALELPSTGIITPWEVAIALAEEAVMNGTDLYLKHQVTAIERISTKDGTDAFAIHSQTPDGTKSIMARRIINAAGVYADQIYAMISEAQRNTETRRFSITPRKGEYYVVDHEAHPLVERIIYPVPSEKGKGVLVVPTIHNNLLIGPNSDFTEDKDDNSVTPEALAYVRREISKTVKDIPFHKVIRNFSGLRPTGDTHDFVIEEASDVPGFILVAAIESPGLTAAPAISEYVIHEILSPQMELIPKTQVQHRRPFIALKDMTPEQYNEMISKDPSFGRMICRCEQITEGEVLDAIHRPVGARTLKGIKKRCRPGMGRCQGGFCEPLVTEILCRELGVTPEELLHIYPGDAERGGQDT